MKTAMLLIAVAAGTAALWGQEEPRPPRPPRAGARQFVITRGGSYLGIGVADVDSERAKALKLAEERGVEVKSVTPDGPAAKAGIKENDVILEYNGQQVEGKDQLMRMVRETPPGREVKLLLSRDGNTQTVQVTLGRRAGRALIAGEEGREWRFEMPEFEIPPIPPIPDLPRSMMSWRSTALGIESESLSSQLAEYFGVKEGVLVRAVMPKSPAEKAGLKAGDVITRVDGDKVTTPREISSVLRAARGTKRTLPVVIVRERKEMTLTVTLEDAPARGERTIAAIPEDVAEALREAAAQVRTEMRRRVLEGGLPAPGMIEPIRFE